MTQTQAIVLALVTPAAGGVAVTVTARVVPGAQVGHGGIGLPGTLLEVGGPVHALAVWKGCEVGISVNTHLHVLTPHAHGAGAVVTRVSEGAGHGTRGLGLLLAATLITLINPRDQALALLALLLVVPHALVHHVAAIAGVEVTADLLGLALEALGCVPDNLDVLDLGALVTVTPVAAPHTAPRVGQTGLAGGLTLTH